MKLFEQPGIVPEAVWPLSLINTSHPPPPYQTFTDDTTDVGRYSSTAYRSAHPPSQRASPTRCCGFGGCGSGRGSGCGQNLLSSPPVRGSSAVSSATAGHWEYTTHSAQITQHTHYIQHKTSVYMHSTCSDSCLMYSVLIILILVIRWCTCAL